MPEVGRDSHSLVSFKRNTEEFIRQLKETGAPVVLTVDGHAELVIQDARAYQRLVEIAAPEIGGDGEIRRWNGGVENSHRQGNSIGRGA